MEIKDFMKKNKIITLDRYSLPMGRIIIITLIIVFISIIGMSIMEQTRILCNETSSYYNVSECVTNSTYEPMSFMWGVIFG